MRYRIGDVAKILGISPDLLRYYEKKGVVRPVKDKNNDYRYYEPWDINFLLDCLLYKNFGFGIDEIAEMVNQADYDDLLDRLEGKERELEAQLRHQQLLTQRGQEHLAQMQQARQYLGRCDIRSSPEIVRYLNRYNFIYDKSEELQQLSQQWLKYMPFTTRYFEIERDTLLQGGDTYAWGFSMDVKYVDEFGVAIEPPIARMPVQRCLHSVFTSSGKTGFSPQHLTYLLDYAQAHHLEVVGPAQGNLLCSVVDGGKITGYFEVWIPIAGEDAQA